MRAFRWRTVRTTLGFACLALWVAAGCGPESSGGDGEHVRTLRGLTRCSVRLPGYYYIGVTLPFTGSLAAKARSRELATMLALDEINAAGGVGPERRTIGLVSCDTKKEPAVAAAAVEELAQAAPVRISAIVGPATSSCTLAAAKTARSGRIAIVSPSATSAAITALDAELAPAPDFVYRTATSDAFQGKILAAIAKREGHRDVLVIHRDDDYGRGLRDEFRGCFTDALCYPDALAPSEEDAPATALGYDEASIGYDEATLDADALAREAMAAEPDAVLLISYVADGAAILKAASNLGWKPAWLLSDGVKDPDLIREVGVPGWLDGTIGTTPSYLEGGDYDTFVASYRSAWGKTEQPLNFSANAYDAAYLIAIAMALSGDPEDGAAVEAQLRATAGGTEVHPQEWTLVRRQLDAGAQKLNYEGASGPVDFPSAGDVHGNVEEWGIHAGEIVSQGCWTQEIAPCGSEE